MVVNALSVDVEDWFQVYALERAVDRDNWDSLEHRVARNTEAVLELFGAAGVKGTFFTLGWVADRHPGLMRRIVAEGHELASHGWDHQRVYNMGAEQFRADVTRTKQVLEDAAGVEIRGYRAPSFSFDTRTPWAHEVLVETGHAYSSSVAPLAHDHYGWPDAPRRLYQPVPGADFHELPVTIARVLGRSFVTGGGYFRLLPSMITDRAIRRANAEDRPAIFYFHPWEIDPGQPRVPNTSLKSRLRHYSRLEAMAGKLAKLVREHRWDRVDRVIEAGTCPRP
ncbi:XrtA system polysaccharide deacetylase [Sphingomonas kyeonggiensis]|uniref:Chitooligosaccharide deacetylase n=1 Tax=Sphingomonas kyeonggiensis TaxID=1268553 RepID=A0A7W6JPJ1_9SPHN|nr:XrtA system polysaccharide deacetylase [Sphingomonas kyeonggiensis]MBB4097188.1 polysaccharide deacetylase family protein (PEP-CTERM system associated) [Sphingomonas kyeonggiensis]